MRGTKRESRYTLTRTYEDGVQLVEKGLTSFALKVLIDQLIRDRDVVIFRVARDN